MRVKRLFSIILSVSMSIALMPILDLSTALANDTMIYEWDFRDYSGDEAVSSTGETSEAYAVSDHVLEIHLANGDSITENGLYWSTPGGTVSDDTTTVKNNRYIVFRPKYDGNLAVTYKGSDNNSRNHPRMYLSCGDALSCTVKGTNASQKEPNQMYDNNSLEFATGSYNVKSGNTYYIWGYHYSRTGTAFTVSNIVYNADTSTGQPQATSKPEDDALKLMALDFNDENDRLKTINGSVALEQGQMAYSTGKDGTSCAYFDGTGSGWLDVKNSNGQGLFAGKDNITISFSSKTDAAPSWWMFAASNSAAPVYQKEKYLGILDEKNKLTVERYKNEGARADSVSSSYSSGEWKDVVISLNNKTTELYVNGKFVDSKDYEYAISDICGENPITYIGKATWGSGEYANGYLDNFVVYDYDIIPDLGDTSAVTSDLNLPTSGKGYSIVWKSSNTDVISNTGNVKRPEKGKKKVTLTATIMFDTHTLTRSYDAYVLGEEYYDYQLEISQKKGVDIQQNMYGLFFEDINYAADGGLYAEMIENRSFEAQKSLGKGAVSYDGLYGWSVYPSNGSGASMLTKSTEGLNENNKNYIEFTASGTQKGFKNQAYDGIYMEAGKSYKVSLFAKKGTYAGKIKASVYSSGTLAVQTTVADNLTDIWTKYEATIIPDKTVRNAEFIIELDGEGSADFDMISCIPADAVDGVFRKDLAEKLKALNPGFLRFPGGCIIEGYNLANQYNWKDTVGPVEERKQNWSRWSCHTNSGIDNGFKHYNQTYGIGFYEYFKLCEYLDCDAVPVVNVGMACEYQSKETVPVFENDGKTYTSEFYQYIQDALDLIEFANGDLSTTWGKVRCDMGHEEPFNLSMIGIGNEQWYINGNQWYDRYEAFEQEIHKVYPDIKLISTSGPSASGTSFDEAWKWIRENSSKNDSFTYAVDEHYYMSPEWFLANDTRYDKYDRNTKVFAGEYAAHTTLTGAAEKKNNLESAIAEAAFMTGLERNADVVYMASYAPLFARLNYTQWAPDMIWFNDVASYVSPTYWVQSMYMNNNGDYTLKSTVNDNYEKVYQSVSYDKESGDIIVKMINPYTTEKKSNIVIDSGFTLTGKADVEMLKGDSLTDVNSISAPDNIAPEKTTIDISNNTDYILPPLSFTVMRVHTNSQLIRLADCRADKGIFKYELESGGDISEYDIYTALYDNDGKLVNVWKNELSGTANLDVGADCDIKVMVWEKNSMKPVCEAIEQSVNTAEKITEYKYLFTDDKVVKTSGSASSGDVYEWTITSAPQYFYIDNIDFDAVESITIRSGYQSNSAVTSVYAYDNDGNYVSENELKKFVTNPTPLGNPIGTIADTKTATWGYRTGVIGRNNVTISEGSNYTLSDTSKILDIPSGTGKKALIVGITGNIGEKGYFDYITVKYNKEVDAPMPVIESITGEGIKDFTVEINQSDKSILIPVIPGTNLNTLKPEIKMSGNASVKLTSGTWKDGQLTISYGDESEVWSIKAEDRGNPVLNGYYADPNLCIFGDTFYLYPTTDGGTGWNSSSFKAFSSKDLINWKDEGEILSLKDVSWSSGVYAWAPTAVEKDGKYYYYYSGTQSIGVAVSDSPTGPFIDKGEPLVNKNTVGLSGQMIDPAAFIDDDGQAYIYWGNGRMYMAKLTDDMMSIDGEIHTITPSNFREGAFVIKRNGIYYFMWSDNDTGEPTYEVRYGTSNSPYGPIQGNTRILTYSNTDDSRIRGTGHHSVINVPGTDDWYICYHRFNVPRYGTVTSKNSEAGNHREICIEKMEFDENGNIKPVTATLKGITEPVTIER